jgi:ankyrin repeat protein
MSTFELRVNKEEQTEVCGLSKKYVSTIDEAKSAISAARIEQRTAGDQVIFFLQMERVGKRKRVGSSESDGIGQYATKPMTGRLMVALLSPLSEGALAADAKVAAKQAQDGVTLILDQTIEEETITEESTEPILSFLGVVTGLTNPVDIRVQYRKSMLTQILRSALGGNCRTNMVVAVNDSPDATEYNKLLLQFASRARNVKNHAVVSQKFKAMKALMSQYQQELNLDDASSESSEEEINEAIGEVYRARRASMSSDVHKRTTRRFLGPQLSNSELTNFVPGQVEERPLDTSKEDRVTKTDPFARKPGSSVSKHTMVEFPEEAEWDIRGRPRTRKVRRRNSWTDGTAEGVVGSLRRPSVDSEADIDIGNALPTAPAAPAIIARRLSADGPKTTAKQRRRSSNSGPRLTETEVAGPKQPPSALAQPTSTSFVATRRVEVENDNIKLATEYESRLAEQAEKHRELLEQMQAALHAAGEEMTLPAESGVVQTGVEQMWSNLISQMSGEEGIPSSEGGYFTAGSCLTWIMEHVDECTEREAAVELMESLLEIGAVTDPSDESGNLAVKDDEAPRYIFAWEEQLEEQFHTRLEVAADEGGYSYDEKGMSLARQALLDDYKGEHTLPTDPLLYAIATSENLTTIKGLAEGMGVSVKDALGRGCMSYACITGNERACKWLSKLPGADVNEVDKHGHTPLLWAAYKGHSKIMRILIRAGAILEVGDKLGRTSLHWSTRLESCECLKVLILCAQKRSAPDAQYFLNMQDRSEQLSALHWAVAAKNQAATRLLVRAGADCGAMDSKGRNPLAYANKYSASDCFLEITQGCPKCISHRDADGRTPLHFVCGAVGETRVVESLLQNPEVNVNAYDMHMRTPLHWAATYNKVSSIKLLLIAGARRDAVDIYGRRPIELAVAKGNTASVKALHGSSAALHAATAKRQERTEDESEEEAQHEMSAAVEKRWKKVQTQVKIQSNMCVLM